MDYRPCPDIRPPADADIDTPETVESAIAITRGERHLRILAELTEIGLTLAKSLAELAQARIEAAKGADGALAPGEDPTAAFSKISQTIRRTIDLEARLAEQVNTRRAGLTTARSTRRAALDKAHKGAMDEAIIIAVIDAFCDAHPEAEAAEVEAIVESAENFRSEYDEFRNYLDRPVGETVARLCALLRLDPTSCVLQDGAWMVRHPSFVHVTTRNPTTGAADWSVAAGPPP